MKGQELVLVKCEHGALPARVASESCCDINTSHMNWDCPVWLEPSVRRWASAQLLIHEHPCCRHKLVHTCTSRAHTRSLSCHEREGPVLTPHLSTTRRGAPLCLSHSGATPGQGVTPQKAARTIQGDEVPLVLTPAAPWPYRDFRDFLYPGPGGVLLVPHWNKSTADAGLLHIYITFFFKEDCRFWRHPHLQASSGVSANAEEWGQLQFSYVRAVKCLFPSFCWTQM